MKVISILVALMLMASPCFALLDDNSEQQQQGQAQGQGQGQQQGQVGINEQGQKQGQIGINEQGQNQSSRNRNSNRNSATALQGQAQGNVQDISVGGDEVNTYVMTAPDTVAEQGQAAFSGYSIFGGINIVDTEESKLCIEKIVVISQMSEAGLITKEEAIVEARIAFQQLKDATKTKRILSIFPETRGKHIFNLFGIISTDACDLNIDNLFGLLK